MRLALGPCIRAVESLDDAWIAGKPGFMDDIVDTERCLPEPNPLVTQDRFHESTTR
jgi:hypothetical protein